MAYDIQVFQPFTITHGQAFEHAQAVVPGLLGTYAAQLTAPAQISWDGGRCTFCLPTAVGTITGIIDIHPTHPGGALYRTAVFGKTEAG